jgi:hypothetical protein
MLLAKQLEMVQQHAIERDQASGQQSKTWFLLDRGSVEQCGELVRAPWCVMTDRPAHRTLRWEFEVEA